MRPPSLLLAALAATLLLVSGARAQEASSWTGDWRTFWVDGRALMTLTQDDDVVIGRYEPGGGVLQGRVEGDVLRGEWNEGAASGAFVFALAPDRRSFTGRFGTGGYWNGERSETTPGAGTGYGGTETPRDTLRGLLRAGNDAIRSGNVEALRQVDARLIFEGGVEDSRDRNRRRLMLWRLVDLSTFRSYDAPERVDGDEASFVIGPSAGAARTTLRFRRIGRGWRLVAPDAATLAATTTLFLEAMDEPSVASARAAWRDSPRGVMIRFIEGTHTWADGGEEVALETLDLSFLPAHLRAAEGPILADYLKQILDRVSYVVWQEVPNDPRQATPYVHYEHAAGSVAIERVRGPDGTPGPWRFTADTLRTAPEVFAAIQALPPSEEIAPRPPLTEFFTLRERIRETAPRLLRRDVLLENWQWLALLGATLVALFAGWLAGRLLRAAAGRLPIGADAQARRARAAALARPVALFVVVTLLLRAFSAFGTLGPGFEVIYRVLAVLAVVAGAWFAWRLAETIGDLFANRAAETPGYADEIVASLATGVAKLLIAVAALIAVADIAELPYEGVLTGLGVGGVAVAFAARETVSNMLAGALLLTDRPFKRGDMVETHGTLAIVETVGLRSTRLKRLDDTVMIIPNSQLSDQPLVNWGVRRRRRVDLPIAVTYSTPRETLDAFVEELRETVRAQPGVDPDEVYVAVSALGDSAIEIECWTFFRVAGYDAQLRARHRLVGDVIALAERMGVEFAFPTRTVHVLNAPPEPFAAADDGRAKAAAAG